MQLQDPRQVDRAHKTVLLQTNALTRPKAGRRSTQNSTITDKCSYKTQGRSTEHTKQYYYKQMLLEDPRQVDGAHKTVLLQTNALRRPKAGRQSTQNSTITNKCSYKTQGSSA